MVLSREVGPPRASSRLRHFGQDRSKRRIAFAGLPALLLARAFIVSWTHTSSRGEMPVGWEAAHVHTDLRDDLFGCFSPYPRDGIQPVELFLVGTHAFMDLRVHVLDCVVEEIDMRQLLSDEKTLVGSYLAGQRLLQLRNLQAQLAPGQLRHASDVHGASKEQLDHGPSRLPDHVARH